VKKLLLALFAVSAISSSFACKVNLDKSPIKCGGKNGKIIDKKSTLKDVLSLCHDIQEPKWHKGHYKVEFDDDTGEDYKCTFANSKESATVVTCKDV